MDRRRALLVWGPKSEERAEIRSTEELDEQLERLHIQAEPQPFIAELVLPSGASLAIGLGRTEAVLSFIGPSLDPPYYHSVGPAEAEGTVVLRYFGDWTEVPATTVIPLHDAREAMRRFLETGALPTNLNWDED